MNFLPHLIAKQEVAHWRDGSYVRLYDNKRAI